MHDLAATVVNFRYPVNPRPHSDCGVSNL